MTKLLAFDLETTGLDTGNDRIIEFCFISLDEHLEMTGRFKSLVNPGIPIPPESTEIHGISDEEVSIAPPFSKYAPRIQELVNGSVLVAHNGSFDLAVLNAELIRNELPGLRPNHPLIDTLLIERFVNSHKLESAYERYVGQSFANAHRAEADTLATVAVLRGQRQNFGQKLPEKVENLVTRTIQELAGHELKEFLDHDRRFYRDTEGKIRFNFGQHRGDQVSQRKGYLEWMLRREFSEDTIKVAKELLKDLTTN